MAEPNQLIAFTKWALKWMAILCGGLIGLAIVALAWLWCSHYLTYELPKSQIHVTVSYSKECMFKNTKKKDIPPWEKDWGKMKPTTEDKKVKEKIKQEPWANDPIVGIEPRKNEPKFYEGLYPILVKIENGSSRTFRIFNYQNTSLPSWKKHKYSRI
jgi:hypothetical protein